MTSPAEIQYYYKRQRTLPSGQKDAAGLTCDISTTKELSSMAPKKDRNHAPPSCSESTNGTNGVADSEPIVITGISGRFPMSNSMAEFQHNLVNEVDMISDQTRWKHYKVPKRMGFVQDWDKFDSSFFNIVPKVADVMDPQGRKLLETTFEAIVDSGYSPEEFRGTRTGVFVGAYGDDSVAYHAINGFSDHSKKFYMLAKGGFMLANRISFVFDLQGPSFKLDTACSSSSVALEQAVSAIRSGTCDAAIVAAAIIYSSPEPIENLAKMGTLSPEGLSQPFDAKANGYVRSEAVVSMVIQKASVARRNYATIRHVMSSTNGCNPVGLAQTSATCQAELMKQIYAVAGINPADVAYVEAHGTGTPAGDPIEVEGLYNTFCKNVKRDKPLIIGSVKSSVGHTEPAAGLVAIAKVLTAIQKGFIPANLNFNVPNPMIQKYLGENIVVADRKTEWPGGLIGLSAYGIGGTNVHVVLEPGPIQPSTPLLSDDLPLVIPFSGRSRGGTEKSLLEAAKMAEQNPHVAALVQASYSRRISKQNYRGYSISTKNGPQVNVSQSLNDRSRPLWFVYPGLGSQWEGMAQDMIKFPPFALSIMECERVLKPVGIDLQQLILAPQCPSLYTNIRHAFVSIVVTQVALHDLLTAVGLKPDGYVGHSCGEILCAYADGGFTREEAVLAADARGRAFLEAAKDSGAMASIGLSWSEAAERLPAEVVLACNNSPSNVTVCGPKENVGKFVDQLKVEGVFAREVNSCSTASHSKHVSEAADLFVEYLNQILPEKRPRTSKWISTSIPESEWNSEHAKVNDGEYHGNNAIRPVLFLQALQHVPSDAIVVEVSPRGFFQSLLKESLPNCIHVPIMTSSPSKDQVLFSLNSIGELYNNGVDLNMSALYPKLTFPVPANTPCISPLVEWNHDSNWNTSIVSFPKRPGKQFEFDINDESDAYLHGHKIGSKIIYPAGGYLAIAWNAMADLHGQELMKFPVKFENVSFESATVLQPGSRAVLKFAVLDQTGSFTITDGVRIVVRGTIKPATEGPEGNNFGTLPHISTKNDHGVPNFMDKAEAYKELRLRGYNYSGYFQGIDRMSVDGTQAELEWIENWTSFLDSMLQMSIFSQARGRTAVPTRIDSVTILPGQFERFVAGQDVKIPKVPSECNGDMKAVKCPGVEIRGLHTTVLPSISNPSGSKIFKRHVFTPYFNKDVIPVVEHIVARVLDIVLQQRNVHNINVVELCPDAAESVAGLYLEGVDFEDTVLPRTQIMTLSKSLENPEVSDRLRPLGIRIIEKESIEDIYPPDEPIDMLWLSNGMNILKFDSALQPGTYVAVCYRGTKYESPDNYKMVASFVGIDRNYVVFQKVEKTAAKVEISSVAIPSDNFNWLPALQAELHKSSDNPNRRVYLVAQNDHASGLFSFVRCLRKESGGEVIRGILDPDGALELDFKNPGPVLARIIEDDLAINVIRNGQPGTFCHISMERDFQDDSPTKPCEHAVVDVCKPGDMSSLRWLEGRYSHFIPSVLPGGMFLCRVKTVGLNFRDVMHATAKIPYDQEVPLCESIMGFEYAGIGPNGRRVMGVVPRQGMATTVLALEDLCCPIPAHWTFEEAATVPLAYWTAFYALMYRGRLQKGQSILIHSGTGGVGQAAIRVAMAIGLEIFTTVGSAEKRKFIKELFPQLKDENIGNSRDCSFEAMVMTQTKGLGVNAVLNSLAEDKFYASIRSLSKHGKFLEIGSYDFFRDSPVGSSMFLRNTEFHGIRVNELFDGCKEEKAFLVEQLAIGTKNGTVVPLRRKVFQVNEIEQAFRFMAAGTHTGKIVINVDVEKVKAVPRTFFSQDKAYIVIGGLGGLGLETSSWMVDRGVRHLIIPSRSGLTTGYQAFSLKRWEKLGCLVETPKVDLSNFDKAEELIKSILQKKELGGIINSAMVIRDGRLQDLTTEDFEIAATSKVPLSKNLDVLTRKYCPNLDYFVCYSSVVGGFGHQQQSNYGFSNSAMERICENRRRDGLHGLAIQWGVIGDVGFFEYKFQKSANYVVSYKGLQAQKITSCLDFLDRALQAKDSIITSFVLADQLNKVDAMKTGLMVKVMNMFGIPDVNKLAGSTKLADLGMDSLIAVELAKVLENDYDIPVSPTQLRSSTIQDMRSVENGFPVKFE